MRTATETLDWPRLAAFLLLSVLLGYCWLFGNSLSTVSAQTTAWTCLAAVAGAGGRGRRRKQGRGLPGDDALQDLAKTYLETQRRLWPELVDSGSLPEPTDDVLASMAESFRNRFLDRAASTPQLGSDRFGAQAEAAVYIRFSSDQSNPRSLDQQLRLSLERARTVRHFVPWSLVFADSGITGTTADRRGYQLMQAAFADRRPPKALYFDDLSRLSRDMAESTRFCRRLHEAGVRVLGASDGFDTDLDQYKTILGVSGLVHEFYIDGLKKKVERGMADGFRQGKNLRPAAFGYRLVPVMTPDGRPVLNRKRQQALALEIHPEQAEIVREVFRRYLEGGSSPQQIARWLNEIQAGGRQAWGTSQVADMLDRWDYVGIQIRGMTRQRKDRETGKITEEQRPKTEWLKRRARHLQIVDRKTWKAVRKRRAERARLFPEGSRGRVATYPTRLLSLVCGGCGAALVLGKSGQYAQVRCPNATEGKLGCTFAGYKSLNKIEGPILKLVAERLSDPDLIDQVVAEANAAAEDMAKRPKPDLAPLQERLRELKETETRLVEAIEKGDAAVKILMPRLEENQRQLTELRSRLVEAKLASADPPEPLTAEIVREMLADLRGLLAEDCPIAAPILRELLGDVIITQQLEAGREKPVWYAEIRIDPLRGAAKLTGGKGSGDAALRLSALVKNGEGPVRLRIRLDPVPKEPKPTKVPPYVQLADEAVRLRDKGLTFAEIGRRLGVNGATAMRTYDHGRPDERPAKGKKRPQAGSAARVRRQIMELLAAGHSVPEVARQAGCSTVTVFRTIKATRTENRSRDSDAA